jgi:hypothetical protein
MNKGASTRARRLPVCCFLFVEPLLSSAGNDQRTVAHLDIPVAVVLAAVLLDRECAVEPRKHSGRCCHVLDQFLGHGVLCEPLLDAFALERELGVNRQSPQHVEPQGDVIPQSASPHARWRRRPRARTS